MNIAKITYKKIRGSRVKFRVAGRVWCDRMQTEIRNTGVLNKLTAKRLGLTNNCGTSKVSLSDLHYDYCDRVI